MSSLRTTIAATLAALLSGQAWASSCYDYALGLPYTASSTPAPTNFRLIYEMGTDLPNIQMWGLREASAGSGDTGSSPPLSMTMTRRNRVVILTPDPLAPSTTYEVYSRDAYAAGGPFTFTTGTGPDIEPPTGTSVLELRVDEDAGLDYSYGDGDYIYVALEPSADAWTGAYYEVEVEGGGESQLVPSLESAIWLRETGPCAPNIAKLEAPWTRTLRARAVDYSGNTSSWTETITFGNQDPVEEAPRQRKPAEEPEGCGCTTGPRAAGWWGASSRRRPASSTGPRCSSPVP